MAKNNKKYDVKKSKIQGDGAFAKQNLQPGEYIGKVHTILQPYVDYEFTELGRKHNHSDNPNVQNVLIGNERHLVAIKPIKKGQELKSNYRLQPDLEQPEDFEKDDTPVKAKKGGWLDKYGNNINANEGTSSAPEGWVGEGYSTKGRNYSPAWGGQFQDGGLLEVAQKGILKKLEKKVDKYLESPKTKGINYSVGAVEKKGATQRDALRHAYSSMETNKAIQKLTGNVPIVSDALGFLGANALGVGHELSVMLTPGVKTDLRLLRESGEDIFNNFIGSLAGSLPFFTDKQKREAIQKLSDKGLLPAGTTTPGVNKTSRYAMGGEIPQAQKGRRTPIETDDPRKVQAYYDSIAVTKGPMESYRNSLVIKNLIEKGNFDKANQLLTSGYIGNVEGMKAYKRLTKYNKKEPKPIKGSPHGWGLSPNDPATPVFKNPVQPYVLQKKPKLEKKVLKEEPVKSSSTQQVVSTNTETPVQKNQSAPKGDYVFGPANSVIGVVNNGVFTKVDMPEQRGGANKADLDLLNNEEALRKYVQQKGLKFAMGGSLPGSVGFTYARTQGAAPSEGPYAKKTLPSAQDGTKLTKAEEKKYQSWRSNLPKNLQYEGDYDLRGLWKENPKVKPSPNLHFPDTYKLPNHPTFSNESKYYDSFTPGVGGYWGEGEENFIKNPQIGPPIPHAEHGMSYYQHGLDWKPKTISKNGSATKQVDINGPTKCGPKQIYLEGVGCIDIASKMYQDLYNAGKLGQRDADGNLVTWLPEVVVKSKMTPEQKAAYHRKLMQQDAIQNAFENQATIGPAKEQPLYKRTWDIATHPFTAIRSYNKTGYVPSNLGAVAAQDDPAVAMLNAASPAVWARGLYKAGKQLLTHPVQTPIDVVQGAGNLLGWGLNKIDAPLPGQTKPEYVSPFGDVGTNARALEFLGNVGDAAPIFEFAPLLKGLQNPITRSMESGLLSNTYKLNPWRFKPNPESAYRMIGNEEGLASALESGYLKPSVKGSDIGKIHTSTHYQIGAPSDTRKYFGRTFGRGYEGPYMAEVPGAATDVRFAQGPGGKEIGADVWTYPENYIPTSEAKLYKKDWLRGYKEVPKPTSVSSSVDDQLKIIQGDYLESELPKNYILQSDIDEFFNRQKEWIQSDEYVKRRSAATGETADQIKKDVDDILNKWKDVKILSEKNDRLINANAAGMYDELDNVVALNPELSRRDALSALDHEIKHAISQIATTKNYKNYPKANIGNPLLEFFNLNSDFSYLSQPWEQQVRALRLLDFMEKKYGIPRGTQLSIDDVNKLHDDIQIGGKYGKEFVNDYHDLVPYLNRMVIEDRKLKFTPNDLLKGKNPFKSEKQGNFTKNLLNQLNRAYAIPAGVITAGSILSSNEQKKEGGWLDKYN